MVHPEICHEISRLVNYGEQKKLISKQDRVYAANRLLEKLELSDYEEDEINETLRYPADILENMCSHAVSQGLIEDTGESRDKYDTELMDCLMPRPSEVVHTFNSIAVKDKRAATDYYYDLSKSSNYIRVDRIEKDLMWKTETAYGDMIITVNLSKPEKDPKDIAAARNAVQSGYPKCALCRENEGFAGGANQAARANLRLIPLTLGGENWFMQYSPYVYYNEHCILLNEEHKPMTVSRKSMDRLLEFVLQFPHYFVGSNADLPIVGGSILTHDHFQGGNYDFPMAKAGIREKVSFQGYEDMDAGIVNWPMSTIRISGTDKNRLVELAGHILDTWRGYSDKEAEILAFTGETPHNTITPIARFRDGKIEMDLVLRNNRTNEEHPMGIFHPHSEYHNIKKENIGLIEVMGLAILPARLLTEIELIKTALLDSKKEQEIFADSDMEKHRSWFDELKKSGVNDENALEKIQDSIGSVFMKILENAGVYKDTQKGNECFRAFCGSVSEHISAGSK